MKRILVTGGAGFIGSHTVIELLELNYEIIIIDSYVNSSIKTLNYYLENNKKKSNIKIFNLDLRDLESIEEIFSIAEKEGKSIDAVIHFSGLKAVGESVSNPLIYWDCNVIGTLNLLKMMDKYECYNLVFSSSATVYEESDSLLLNEQSKIKPKNPYGKTKLAVEEILTDLYNSNKTKWKIACLRYFNPIGAHPQGYLGEEPLNVPNNIFPIINKVALGQIKELKVFGNDWPTTDGTAIRDYIHVQDLAKGHIKTLDFLFKQNPQILKLNLGTGIGTSVLDLIKTFEKVNKVKIPYIFTERRSGDSCHTVADNSQALEKLDWHPIYNLNDMCRDGWNWYSKGSQF